MSEQEGDEDEVIPDANAFAQRLEYRSGTSHSAKLVFADSHATFVQKEAEPIDESVVSAQKQKLQKKLHQRTQHGTDAKAARVQQEFAQGNFAAVMNSQKFKNMKNAKLPKEYRALMSQMSEMRDQLHEMKELQVLEREQQEQQQQQQREEQTKLAKPLPSRPSVEDDEKMKKLLRNRRKREKKKEKLISSTSAK